MNSANSQIFKQVFNLNENYFHILIETCPLAFIIMRNNRILYANQTCLKMFGYSPDYNFGKKSLFDYIAPQYREGIRDQALRRLGGEAVPNKYETFCIKSTGEVFPCEVEVSVLSLAEAKTFVAYIADTSSQASIALVNTRKKYLETPNSLLSMIIRWTGNGKINFINEYGLRFLGVSSSAIINQDLSSFNYENLNLDIKNIVKLMDNVRQDPVRFEFVEHEYVNNEGFACWIGWHNIPIYSDCGELLEVLSVGADYTEKMLTEENRCNSHNEQIAILNNLQDTYYRANQEGVIQRVSPSVEQLLGYSLQEFRNLRLTDLYIDPDGQEKFFQTLVTNKGSVSNYQAQLRRKDGSAIWVSTNAHFCRDDNGHIVGVEGTTRDISVLKNYEQALQQSEARFRAIFECSPSGIILLNLSDQSLTTNRAVQVMLGYSAQELAIMKFFTFIHPEDVEKVVLFQHRILSGHSDNEKCEIRCFHKLGHQLRISLNMSAIYSDSDKQSFICVLEDITEQKSMEVALRQGSAKFEAIYNAISDAVVFADAERKINMINTAVTRIFGYQFDELKNRSTETLYASKRDFIKQGKIRFNKKAENQQKLYEVIYRRKDGSEFVGETFGTKIQDKLGNVIGYIGFIRDISERKSMEERLRLGQKIFEDAGKAILVTDAESNIIEMNDAFCETTGYTRVELVGKTPEYFQSARHDRNFYRQLTIALNSKGYWQGEFWQRKKNGEEYPNWASISVVKDEKGITNNYIAVFSDITSMKETEERLEHLAHYDQLTGLPNRMLFHDRLHSAVARAKRHKTGLAVMYVDLDGFKLVNDTLGHAAGDKLLKKIARRLKHCVRDEDTVARLGGDEFAIIITELQGMDFLHTLANRIVDESFDALRYSGRELRVSASVGVATFPTDGSNEVDLLRNADQAMYHAKQIGKNTYQFFDPKMNEQMMMRIHMESDLHYALKHNELFVQFQPKFDLKLGKVVGVEALARWQHKEKGLIPPAEFVPVAEDSELIVKLGKQIMIMTCCLARRWYDKGYHSLPVAINISSRQFKGKQFIDDICYALNVSRLPANLLEIEITESLLMVNVEATIEILNELKSMGVRISIDDFGTGYSSLNYLKKLPVDTLKIDKSFVMDIVDDDDDRAIISAIISMAKSLNLRVIAEGVENEQQLAFLNSQHCHEIQGYLLAMPMNYDDLEHAIISIESKRYSLGN